MINVWLPGNHKCVSYDYPEAKHDPCSITGIWRLTVAAKMLETVAVDPWQALGLKKLKSKIKIDVNLVF